MENLYSVEETAEKLKIHPETMRKYIRERRLAAVKIGREWRVRESDLRDFVNARVIPAKEESKP